MANNIIENVVSNLEVEHALSPDSHAFNSLESIYLSNASEAQTKTKLQLNLENSDDSEPGFSQLDLMKNLSTELDKIANDSEELSRVFSNKSSLLTNDNVVPTASSSTTYTNIFGDDKDYLITGDIEDNNLIGWIGNDTIFGHSGNDLIRGHGGDDILYGEEGDDILAGNSGNDILDGGAGNNVLIDNSGSNIFVLSDIGFSRIVYFDLNQDTIELSNGISYEDLGLTGLVNTKISFEGNLIGFVKGVGSSEMSAANFSQIF